MKASVTAILAALVAIIGFLAGRMGAAKDKTNDPADTKASGGDTTVSSLSGPTGGDRKPKPKAEVESRPITFVSDHALTVEEARALTSEERMAMITRGGMSWNSGNQLALMSGVIAALTQDEIGPATEILGGIQDRGNFQTQEVWSALWTQWGRVNPTKALEFFAQENSGKSKSDARNMMTGWLETDPQEAFAWAKQPKSSNLEAMAAALAITWNANGDPKRMEASILSLPADSPEYEMTRAACLQDYYDLVSMSGQGQGAAETYDQLPAALRSTAWPVTLERMILQDPQAAAEWVTSHISDPGRDYGLTISLASQMASSDPVAAIAWATRLPGEDPVHSAFGTWMQQDSEAALAWLRANAADAPWAKPYLDRIGK